ncbi:MAG: hypothetical protein KC503_27585 [Myxococcales bacterium]|nr:hypothetical protein [Myxococcales bacterium]
MSIALVVLALGGCTDTVELVPDAAVDATPAPSDLRPDAPSHDTTGADAAADLGVDSASACVCRFVQCRTHGECQGTIGPSSVCDNPGTLSCSGSTSSCRGDADCAGGAAGWRCTSSPTSLSPCL